MQDKFDLTKLKKQKSTKINSKSKGGRFERKIAEMFNKRFSTNEFCRTPGSGAFATTHSLPEYLKIYGDLITPKGFKFIIECKSGYNKESLYSILNPKSELNKMIAQAVRDSKKSSKNFLLIIGQDRQEPLVLTNVDLSGMHQNIVITNCDSKIYCVLLKDLLETHISFFIEA